MPLHARLDVPGTLHHVMVRGIEGTNIFQDEEDRQAFVERIRSLVGETGTRILAWALMDNHVHLLLISGPAGLPTFMRRLLTGYAVGFNRKHSRFGHLFQNRYTGNWGSPGGDRPAGGGGGPAEWPWRLRGHLEHSLSVLKKGHPISRPGKVTLSRNSKQR